MDAEPVKLAETASAVEASFAGREYRGRPALCAGVQGRQRTAGAVSYTHLDVYKRQELLWSDKVGYVWLTIGVNPVYVDTGIRIESAADLCGKCLDDVATDVLYMTGNDHALEAADPLELAEIKRLWEPYINQLPDYAYLCKDLLNGKM